MHSLLAVMIIFSLFTGPADIPMPATDTSAPAKEVFVGSTPCGQLIRPVHNIAADQDCALVEWELSLLRDPATQQPGNFRLVGSSRYTLPDNNYSQPGAKKEATGKWSIVKGTGSFAGLFIYVLIPDKGSPALRFVKLSDDLLHLLDEQGHYMRGDPFQSYTLNRIANKPI